MHSLCPKCLTIHDPTTACPFSGGGLVSPYFTLPPSGPNSVTEADWEMLRAALPLALTELQERRKALEELREVPDWPLEAADYDHLIERISYRIYDLESFMTRMS